MTRSALGSLRSTLTDQASALNGSPNVFHTPFGDRGSENNESTRNVSPPTVMESAPPAESCISKLVVSVFCDVRTCPIEKENSPDKNKSRLARRRLMNGMEILSSLLRR